MDLGILVVALAPFVVAALFWNQLPDRLAVHFGANGQPDGFQDKGWFLVMVAVMNVGLALLLKVVQWIDPKRENYRKFARFYNLFRVVMAAFMSVIFMVTIFYNLGYAFNVQLIVLSGIGVLFIVIGNYMGQIRFNYFFGIRTPWTLANEEVWRRTHRMAGPLWVAAGVAAFICGFLSGEAAMWIFFPIVIIVGVAPLVYSFVLYRKIVR